MSSNNAAQWRAGPDATNANRHASARPLQQPGYTFENLSGWSFRYFSLALCNLLQALKNRR